MREVLFRVQSSEGDIAEKLAHIRRVLAADRQVKLTVMMRGREIARLEVAVALLDRVVDRLKDIARMEGRPAASGNKVSVVVARSG